MKNVLKKLICTALTAVCVITSVVPTFAEDVITTTEADTTKSVTSAYKYHLYGFDHKKRKSLTFSKTAFYKDLNSLPSIGMGKTTVNVPALPKNAKSIYLHGDEDRYASYVKFKAPKTGTYVCTITNLQGTDDKAIRAMIYFGFCQAVKDGKKYYMDDLNCYSVGDYDQLYENNYLEKLRSMMDAYEAEHPDYANYLSCDYADEETYVEKYLSNKIKFTVRLKKGQTYVYAIDNGGMTTLCEPYHNSFYHIDSMSCLCGGQYTAAYSFDMEIKLKGKK